MRFADEPTERIPSRQITRLERQDPRGSSSVEDHGFDQAVERLTGGRDDDDAADRAQGVSAVINAAARFDAFDTAERSPEEREKV